MSIHPRPSANPEQPGALAPVRAMARVHSGEQGLTSALAPTERHAELSGCKGFAHEGQNRQTLRELGRAAPPALHGAGVG